MNHIHRRPDVGVRIVRPRYESSDYKADLVVEFVPRVASLSPEAKESDALIGYSYEESVSGPESSFSLTFAAQPLADGRSIMDAIQPMDLVFIREFGLDRYCGVVHQVRYSARLSDAGPQRSIIVTGSGIGDLIASFGLLMDYRLLANGPLRDMVNTALKVEIAAAKNASFREVLQIIYQKYIGLATTTPDTGKTVSGVRSILAEFLSLDSIGDDLVSHYPLAIRFFQQGINSIWEIWKSILPPPLYELFGLWVPYQSEGVYQVKARLCPFSASDWDGLPISVINPIALIDYSIGHDDSDATTFFYATLPGSELSEKEVLALDGLGQLWKADISKWPKYGYRPMTATMRYFNRAAQEDSTQEILKDAAASMFDWYCENDRFLSGRITHISVDDPAIMKYARAGERISFVGGEFYVSKTSRNWAYGGSPTTTLDVTRGFKYSSGVRQGPILDLGKRFKELER